MNFLSGPDFAKYADAPHEQSFPGTVLGLKSSRSKIARLVVDKHIVKCLLNWHDI